MRFWTHFFLFRLFSVVRKHAQKPNRENAKFPVIVVFLDFFSETYDRKYLINALQHMEVHVVEMHTNYVKSFIRSLAIKSSSH